MFQNLKGAEGYSEKDPSFYSLRTPLPKDDLCYFFLLYP